MGCGLDGGGDGCGWLRHVAGSVEDVWPVPLCLCCVGCRVYGEMLVRKGRKAHRFGAAPGDDQHPTEADKQSTEEKRQLRRCQHLLHEQAFVF